MNKDYSLERLVIKSRARGLTNFEESQRNFIFRKHFAYPHLFEGLKELHRYGLFEFEISKDNVLMKFILTDDEYELQLSTIGEDGVKGLLARFWYNVENGNWKCYVTLTSDGGDEDNRRYNRERYAKTIMALDKLGEEFMVETVTEKLKIFVQM